VLASTELPDLSCTCCMCCFAITRAEGGRFIVPVQPVHVSTIHHHTPHTHTSIHHRTPPYTNIHK
jgi:hypothetical protein